MTDLETFLQSGVPGMKVTFAGLLSAGVTLLVCLLAVRLLTKLARRLVGRTRLDGRVQKYLLLALRLVLYAVAVIIVLGELHVDASSLVALLSVASLGVTLAAEDILGNVAGGLVILSSHPFNIGDEIEVSGTTGTVREITLNHTKLEAYDGQIIMEPNKTLASAKVVNYTTLGRRRIVHNVTASYDAPTEAVKTACREAMDVPGVLADPAPEVRLISYGSSAIEYSVRCWASVADYWRVYFAVNENLRDAFARHGVEMTYDHLNVHVVEK